MERRFADVWNGQGDPVVLCNGDACVALFEPVEGDAIAADGVNRHFAIRLDRANFTSARAALAERGIEAELWDHRSATRSISATPTATRSSSPPTTSENRSQTLCPRWGGGAAPLRSSPPAGRAISDGGVIAAARPRGAPHAAVVAGRRPAEELARRARATARPRAGRTRRPAGRQPRVVEPAAAPPAASRSPWSCSVDGVGAASARVELAPDRPQAVVVLAPAERARPVAGRHRRRLVEEEELGELPRLEERPPLPSPELEPAGDPAPVVVAAADPAGVVVEAAAVPVDEPAGWVGDELAERRYPVLERHAP